MQFKTTCLSMRSIIYQIIALCAILHPYQFQVMAIRSVRQAELVNELAADVNVDDILNSTIPSNIDVVTEPPLDKKTEHIYYQMTVYANKPEIFKQYYVDLSNSSESTGNSSNATQKHEHLQEAYRKAAGIKLGFPFPFYGHSLNNVTIATGGFLYVGDQTHSWLAATQYIAPLMANFDTMMKDSQILYKHDNEEPRRVIFEWSKVTLRDHRNAGPFTFQVSLWDDGNITIVYKEVPMNVSNISDSFHPCKMGISDAYLFNHKFSDKTAQSKRVIHEYHRITIPADSVKSNTVVHLKALPTCLKFSTCETCQGATLPSFQCTWCPLNNSSENFCSDQNGMNRFRQEFIERGCLNIPKNSAYCPASENITEISNSNLLPESTSFTSTDVPSKTSLMTVRPSSTASSAIKSSENEESGGGAAFLTLFLILGISISIWMIYAYYNPHTSSGQLLIKYRPSKWQVPSSHVRYSASVHM